MNDKTFERASQIKDELYRLESLKRNLEKSLHLSIDLHLLEVIRKPFIHTTESVIAQLKKEYENL